MGIPQSRSSESVAEGRVPVVCEASTYVPPAVRAESAKAYLEVNPSLIADDLMCHLEAHAEGSHFAIVYDHLAGPDAGAIWTSWDEDFPAAFFLRPDCTSVSPQQGVPCGHFAAHPGVCSWRTENRR
ncbi:hypothetical protein VSR01_31485 [Actinacidiphila sp. DG2A-62]|uniref:hypothetical protein n=1 Tax=Actinacidiphila sp. DG2A-62 TaxID=3108821 RepID=UPI002DB8805D|nr:hypothetical protein [Actinacidiphila sp. DG2A-62]MEC3997771.1 hypothetical protein [Actinacidiphila sp. DG2A-62]